jgi:hypothetical protein
MNYPFADDFLVLRLYQIIYSLDPRVFISCVVFICKGRYNINFKLSVNYGLILRQTVKRFAWKIEENKKDFYKNNITLPTQC